MESCIFETLKTVWRAVGRWDGITAISTASAAIFTAIMAWFTRKAIKDGQVQRDETNAHYLASREQDKRHHEDSFRPLLVLMQTDPTDALKRERTVLAFPIDSSRGALVVKCNVKNIGTGPALNVHMHVWCDGGTGFGPTRELTPIASGSEYGDSKEQIDVIAYYHQGFNNADLTNLADGLWMIVLEYDDIFGNTFHTIHGKNVQVPWTRACRGPAPNITPDRISSGVAEHVLPRE